MEKYIYYSAGAFIADKEKFAKFRNEYEILCFCDINAKPGQQLHGLPVYPANALIEKYPHAPIIITASPQNKLEIQDYILNELDLPTERIANFEPYKTITSCYYVEKNIIFESNGWKFCCSDFAKHKTPFINCADINSPQEWVERLLSFKQNDHWSVGCVGCVGCPELKTIFRKKTDSFTTASWLPFRWANSCNLKCVYCKVYKGAKELPLDINFRMAVIAELKRVRLISTETTEIGMGNGEFSLYSKRKEILEALADFRLHIFSNCTIYDEYIAERLEEKRCTINCSLDAGTRDTFAKVKGVDCFDKVSNNLRKYAEKGAVELKYILLPGINDNDTDFEGFVHLASEIKPTLVQLSRDSFNIEKINDVTLGKLANLRRELIKLGINCRPISDYFNTYEIERLNV